MRAMNQKELVFFLEGKENVSIQLDEGEEFQKVLHRLTEKLEAGAMLVSGNKLKLDTGGRVLGNEQKEALTKIFSSHGLPDPFQIQEHAAAPSQDIAEEERVQDSDEETVEKTEPEILDEEGIKITLDSIEQAESAADNQIQESKVPSEEAPSEAKEMKEEKEKEIPPEERTLLVKKTLRSGQSVEYDGNVVILGDVNPGAEVNSGGDILIMGALRGTVHAGCNGDKKAIIAALKFQPVQARIANIAAQLSSAAASELLPQVLSVQHDKIKLDKLK